MWQSHKQAAIVQISGEIMPKQLAPRRPKSLVDGDGEKIRYPQYEDPVRNLVVQHRHSKERSLHLAIYYAPKRHPGDVFLLEVIKDFGGGRVDPGREIFEFVYGSTVAFPLPPSRHLRLVLTNPTEFRKAAKGNWKAVVELRDSRRRRVAQTIFADAIGRRLVELL
jgi:hypothetical protein